MIFKTQLISLSILLLIGLSCATKEKGSSNKKGSSKQKGPSKKDQLSGSSKKDQLSPFTSEKDIPVFLTQSEKLKQITAYCWHHESGEHNRVGKFRSEDRNCPIVVDMLDAKFEKCRKKTFDSDKECTEFLKVFCTASPGAICCPQILAEIGENYDFAEYLRYKYDTIGQKQITSKRECFCKQRKGLKQNDKAICSASSTKPDAILFDTITIEDVIKSNQKLKNHK